MPLFLQFCKIGVQQVLGSHKRSQVALQHLVFLASQHRFNLRIVVEAVAQLFVNGLVHPVFALLIAAVFK